MSKKINQLLVAMILTFLLQNCSEDEHIFQEGVTEFNTKSRHRVSSPETCQVTYTFNQIGLTESQKAAIRASYPFTIYSHSPFQLNQEQGQEDVELWIVNCDEYENYLNQSINCNNSICCDSNGCIKPNSCPQNGCGSTNPPPDDPDDPFEPDEVPH